MGIQEITGRRGALENLVNVWKTAVEETHSFLSEGDIRALEPEVRLALLDIWHLCGAYSGGVLQGFIGVENEKIEMLFVHADARGQGVGKALLRYATDVLGAVYVDVNEQNTQGVGFYRHMGFGVESRSELDSGGRPFPVLHLKRAL